MQFIVCVEPGETSAVTEKIKKVSGVMGIIPRPNQDGLLVTMQNPEPEDDDPSTKLARIECVEQVTSLYPIVERTIERVLRPICKQHQSAVRHVGICLDQEASTCAVTVEVESSQQKEEFEKKETFPNPLEVLTVLGIVDIPVLIVVPLPAAVP